MSQEEASVSWAPQLTDLLRSKIARASVRLQQSVKNLAWLSSHQVMGPQV